ncbi:MAG: hypothetical protein II826_05730 [Prevotella sp.]|nr:hypothetical protein [Prevotella sp.]
MKKTIFTLAALSLAVAANATIFRVSNVAGSTAPYSSISAAHDAASEGDTIMVDGSSSSYGSISIKKRLVLIGPGYYLNANGIVSEATAAATARFVIEEVAAAGTVVMGFRLTDNLNNGIDLSVSKCVIKRNIFPGKGVCLRRGADNTVIHQNYFYQTGIDCMWGDGRINVQVTNNIFVMDGSSITSNKGLVDSYIAYNTIVSSNPDANTFYMVSNSTIEHNIMPNGKVGYNNIHTQNTNSYSDNYEGNLMDVTAISTDKDVQTAELEMSEGKYGAFAGDNPYVISGIPAAPVIQNLVMPTAVEKGKKMNVTIKVGIQR